MGQRRSAIKKTVTEDYLARKAKYPKELPKWLKATRLDLDLNTYKNLVGFKDMLAEKDLQGFLVAEEAHNKKMGELVELKRQLDAQL